MTTSATTDPRDRPDRPDRPVRRERPTLVTGASGYIGGRLVPELLERGHRVRVLARSPERLRDHWWAREVEIVRGDASDSADLRRALDGVGVAYYLLHSMDGGGDFVARDRALASRFARAAPTPGSSGSSTSPGCTRARRTCRSTSPPGSRWARSSSPGRSPRRCSRPGSSWVPGPPRSTCSATSPNGCPR
ncbi:NAD(P)H-binding protein [Salana multivorans]